MALSQKETQRRIKVFEDAKEKLKECAEDKVYHGICWATNLNANLIMKTLYQYIPAEKWKNCFLWTLNKSGYKKRIALLNRIIKDYKAKLK